MNLRNALRQRLRSRSGRSVRGIINDLDLLRGLVDAARLD